MIEGIFGILILAGAIFLCLFAVARYHGVAVTLVILSILPALAACFFLTKATLGVGLLAFSCYLAILARIAQAKKSE